MINASRANMKAGAYEKDETFFEKKKKGKKDALQTEPTLQPILNHNGLPILKPPVSFICLQKQFYLQ